MVQEPAMLRKRPELKMTQNQKLMLHMIAEDGWTAGLLISGSKVRVLVHPPMISKT